jgi:uncharacterized protein involved in high-affinity Fe2+ transport
MQWIGWALAGAGLVAGAASAQAREYPVGGPITAHDMEIAANYLTGIEMAPMLPGMAMGPDVIHLETDVHATADNTYGFADSAWIPYLSVDYRISKSGSDWHQSGRLLPMTAKDGPHYANNVRMPGPGRYTVVFRYAPPVMNGFYRHVDAETGVPAWWPPFEATFSFDYPQK